jgi:NTE family protein
LEEVLAGAIDFDAAGAGAPSALRDRHQRPHGQGEIFENARVTSDVLLASACLPILFQAVEIEGEAYWDGGYSGNRPSRPLVRDCASDDTILVQINPVERPGVPRTAREINNRVNEVSFNAALLKELKMIDLLREVANPGDCEGALWARMRVHRIALRRACWTSATPPSSTRNGILLFLRDEGGGARGVPPGARARAGRRPTLDLEALLRASPANRVSLRG